MVKWYLGDGMDLKNKAKQFAVLAHFGQVRKNEPEKPAVIHPISVAHLLEVYHPEDEFLIAAAYLHDIVEDTCHTLLDIEDLFGKEVAHLVQIASEPNREASWEERKQGTIDRVRTLSLREKWLICADKIDNLSDIKNKFGKDGKKDFSRFKRGENQQRWYYEEVYQSLIYKEDASDPLFLLLRRMIDKVFYEEATVASLLKDASRVEELKKIHAQKQELVKLKNLQSSKCIVVRIFSEEQSSYDLLYRYLKRNAFFVQKGFSDDLEETFSILDSNSFIFLDLTLKEDLVFTTGQLFHQMKQIYLDSFFQECFAIKNDFFMEK